VLRLGARLSRLEACGPAPLPLATAEMLLGAFIELGLGVEEVPLPGETFTDYMRRCPRQAVLAVVRWGFHGIRP
jgi:hypothetical protein